jgi:hypothetical protein
METLALTINAFQLRPVTWLRRLFAGACFSILNACRYRQLRELPPTLLTHIERFDNIDDGHRIVTEALLYSAGLRLTDGTEPRVVRWVWLSAIQRSVIGKVEQYGYRVEVGRCRRRWIVA